MRSGIGAVFIYLLLIVGCTSCGSPKEFRQLKSYDNIDIVHIPRGIGWMIGPTLSMADGEAGRMVRGFRSLTVVDCEGKKGRKEVMECVDRVLDKDKSELIIETHEGKESTFIYGRIKPGDKKIRDLIIVTDEPSDLSVVRIKGSFDLNAVIGEEVKKIP